MPGYDRITSILGFQQYSIVVFKRINKQRIEVWLEPREKKWRCPQCGQLYFVYYDRKLAMLRDLDLAPHMSFLIVPKYRVCCSQCGVKSIPLTIARPRAHCTKRFERRLFVMTRSTPVSEVASEMGVDWDTVRDAEIRHIDGLLRKRDLDGIRDLGIDEVSIRGHEYLTLVTDLQGHRVIWVGEGRSRATLKAFFRWFGKKRVRRLRRFAIDMHEPYELEIRAQCPRAKIIYDHFHLSKLLHDSIDKIRRRLQSELPPADRRYLKGMRYLILKARENATPEDRVKLKELLSVNAPISTGYVLKEDFRSVFREEDPKKARRDLRDWKRRARESKIPELIKIVRTLNRRRHGIYNFFRHRLSNAMSEGYNNVVKTVKKMAYGFRDTSYFCRKILRKCGGLEAELDSHNG